MVNVAGIKWIIGLLIYFVLFFAVLGSINNTYAELWGYNDSRLIYADPGFIQAGSVTYLRPYCTGESDLLRKGFFAGYFIRCVSPDGLQYNESCIRFQGCEWINATETCVGQITNNSVINMSSPTTVCENMTDFYDCDTFQCNWINNSAMHQAYVGKAQAEQQASIKSFWNQVKWVATFNVNIGLPYAFNWLFVFVFFWIPMIILIAAVYVSIPFI